MKTGEYLQMKFGFQKTKQVIMLKEINLKKTLNGKLFHMTTNILNEKR